MTVKLGKFQSRVGWNDISTPETSSSAPIRNPGYPESTVVLFRRRWCAFGCQCKVVAIGGGHRMRSRLALYQTLPSECPAPLRAARVRVSFRHASASHAFSAPLGAPSNIFGIFLRFCCAFCLLLSRCSFVMPLYLLRSSRPRTGQATTSRHNSVRWRQDRSNLKNEQKHKTRIIITFGCPVVRKREHFASSFWKINLYSDHE